MKTISLKGVKGLSLERLANDFRNLDPNDPGQWPLAPRAAALLGLFLGLLGAAWWFDWQDQGEQLAKRQGEEKTLREDWAGKKRQAVNLDAYKKQLDEIDRQFGALLKQLPNRAEMESLLVDINQAGRGRGLQFELWKPGAEAMKEFYAEMPISIKVGGSYHDLGNFVSDVAQLPRIVTLNNIVIETQKDGGLKMDAAAVTYRYLDEEEVAAQKRAKADAAKKSKKKK